MWDNDEWAKAHIKKKHPDVTTEEAWEVVFESGARTLISPDQLHYPPYRRHWKIGKTFSGKLLLVAWETWKEKKNLISAYPPNERQVEVYERQIRRIKS